MPENSRYPRVLVVDPAPFNRYHNTGILKSSLFEGWPKGRLAQVDLSNMRADFDVCERYWRAKKTDVLKGLLGLARHGQMRPPREDSPGGPLAAGRSLGRRRRPLRARALSGLADRLRNPGRESIFRLPSVLSGPLRAWIEDFSPEAIFSIGGFGLMLRTAVKLAQWRAIPIIPYFTDDWVSTLYVGELFEGFLRRSMLFWFREYLALAPVRLVNCDAMAEEYRIRYGGRFETFLISVDTELPNDEYEPPAEQGRTVRFVYIGSLAPQRWTSLRKIGEALMALRSEGLEGELLIYTFPSEIEQSGHLLRLDPVMRIAGTAPADQMLRIARSMDVLVHVESFDPAARECTRFSLSTKIPQYLTAGRCILAYGPKEGSSIRYVADCGAGLAVGEDDATPLRTALRQLITSASARRAFGLQARSVAIQRHDAAAQQKRFRELVAAICEEWKNLDPA